MDKEELGKLLGICDLCRKTGADDSQYILVSIKVLEELLGYIPEVKNEPENGREE